MKWEKDPEGERRPGCSVVPARHDTDEGCRLDSAEKATPVRPVGMEGTGAVACLICLPKLLKYGSAG